MTGRIFKEFKVSVFLEPTKLLKDTYQKTTFFTRILPESFVYIVYLSLNFTCMKSYIISFLNGIASQNLTPIYNIPDNEFFQTFSGHPTFILFLFLKIFVNKDFLTLMSIIFQKKVLRVQGKKAWIKWITTYRYLYIIFWHFLSSLTSFICKIHCYFHNFSTGFLLNESLFLKLKFFLHFWH